MIERGSIEDAGKCLVSLQCKIQSTLMKIDLTKTVFTIKETEIIVDRLQLASETGYLKRKSENNPYLLASYIGVTGALF